MASILQSIAQALIPGFGSSTSLVLGNITFQGFEIPDKIEVKQKQNLVVHKLIGGARKIHNMGYDPDPIQWKGRFRGASGTARCQAVDALRKSGAPQTLTWASYRFSVVVKEFNFEYMQAFEIDYSICCEVLSDMSMPLLLPIPGVPAAITSDLNSALTMTNQLGIGSVSTAVGGLVTTVNGVTSVLPLSQASQSQALQIKGSIAAAQAPVALQINQNNQILTPTPGTGLAGITSGANPQASAASLTAAANAATQNGQLLPLQSTLSRMNTNVGQLGN